jgi:hypothetical protein
MTTSLFARTAAPRSGRGLVSSFQRPISSFRPSLDFHKDSSPNGATRGRSPGVVAGSCGTEPRQLRAGGQVEPVAGAERVRLSLNVQSVKLTDAPGALDHGRADPLQPLGPFDLGAAAARLPACAGDHLHHAAPPHRYPQTPRAERTGRHMAPRGVGHPAPQASHPQGPR